MVPCEVNRRVVVTSGWLGVGWLLYFTAVSLVRLQFGRSIDQLGNRAD